MTIYMNRRVVAQGRQVVGVAGRSAGDAGLQRRAEEGNEAIDLGLAGRGQVGVEQDAQPEQADPHRLSRDQPGSQGRVRAGQRFGQRGDQPSREFGRE